MAIKRVWHGWTTIDNAEAYHQLLLNEVFPGIEHKRIEGYQGIELYRLNHEDEVEFVTIMTFESLQSVISFQGEDYTRCYVPEKAQQVLKRWDSHSAHFEALFEKRYS